MPTPRDPRIGVITSFLVDMIAPLAPLTGDVRPLLAVLLSAIIQWSKAYGRQLSRTPAPDER